MAAANDGNVPGELDRRHIGGERGGRKKPAAATSAAELILIYGPRFQALSTGLDTHAEEPTERLHNAWLKSPARTCKPEGLNSCLRACSVTKSPADCTTKEDVRAELDRIDQVLLTLFAERHRYVTRMAEIKTDPHEAHDPVRINAILQKQRKRADELGLDEDQAELIWKTLIDWNVNYEKGIIVARRGNKTS